MNKNGTGSSSAEAGLKQETVLSETLPGLNPGEEPSTPKCDLEQQSFILETSSTSNPDAKKSKASKTEAEPPPELEGFPGELLNDIASRLDKEGLTALRLVSQKMNKVAGGQIVFKLKPGDDFDKAVHVFRESKHLELNADQCDLSAAQIEALATNPGLRSLSLKMNKSFFTSPDALKTLGTIASIEALSLDGRHIDVDTATALAANPTLKSLSAGGNNVSARAAAILASSKTLTSLSLLDRVLEQRVLAALSKNTTLTTLAIQDTRPMKALQLLKANETLVSLELHISHVSDTEAFQLAADGRVTFLRVRALGPAAQAALVAAGCRVVITG